VKPHHTAIVWLRRDLRLADNPALRHAITQATTIVPAFIHDPEYEAPWSRGAASRWWLHHSLAAFSQDLAHRGCRLILRQGPTVEALTSLAESTGATLVTWNRLYEPGAMARDTQLSSALQTRGITTETCNAALLFEPSTIQNTQRRPYRVFTPFWRRTQQLLSEIPPPFAAPRVLAGHIGNVDSLKIEALGLLPKVRWDLKLVEHWTPGEAGARQQLLHLRKHLGGYPENRDRPDLTGTSRLSPHLHFGEIGPRQILAALHSDGAAGASRRARDAYVRQLGWREFAHHLMFHFPETTTEPLDRRFTALPWRKAPRWLLAWQRGLTGYPIVDAGMRELWATGWMHNRVRMIVASFLTKNLQIHWLAGARWFWETLVDADLANNTLGWQWTAGCGADASPYDRIFNPMLQTERFDPQRNYLRQWLPELARLPDRWIHQPWLAPQEVLADAGVTLGRTYPLPIVDFRDSRRAALANYARIRATRG
jgi:deoxyribodipyrimidine photo-lyase